MKKTRSELSRIHDRTVYYVNEDLELELISELPNMELREIRQEAKDKLHIVKAEFKKFLSEKDRPDILKRIENMTDEEFLFKYHPYLQYLPNDR